MERLVHLRSVPSLGTLQGDGVMYLAQRSKERRWAKGDRVYHPDQRVDCVHFIVEGSIRVIQEGKRLLDSKAPWAVGFQPVLSDSPIPQLAFALEDTITLEVTRADIFELMETDFGFLAAGIRQNSRQMLEYQRRLEGGGNLQRSEPEEVPYPDETLDLVQRLSLSRFGPYADSNIASLLQLVRIQKEVRLPAGSDLWQLGEDALWGIRIVYGVVACEDPTRKFRMGPGSVLGFLEANGSLPRSYSARTETEFVGLRVDTDQFFDVFEDNYNLAVSFIKFSAGWVLDLSVKLAEADIRESESSDAAQ
ncbi:MAG: CRP-like cAMP-binding protein [Bradymonadia bacterium]|jgi:CRP-like cAMP-binding protein